ncbi:MAG: ABC transporter substrate-binding protein [Sphingobacteriaceae bacterium]|nr:ABC transporter substrate-binding protein [Sphingobacteriaceae bacterium]
MHKYLKYSAFVCVLFYACNNELKNSQETKACTVNLLNSNQLKYAKLFSFAENKFLKVVYVYDDESREDTIGVYYLLKDSSCRLNTKKNNYIFNSPLQKIVSLSCVYSLMLTELNQIDKLVGIENIDYYNNPDIIYKYKQGELTELAKGPKLDLEKTIQLKPQIVFDFGMQKPEFDSKLRNLEIEQVFVFDHLEKHPLARAEWIKFFAFFTNAEHLADSIFQKTEEKYLAYKNIASQQQNKPLVLTEVKTGELWYVPGGKSGMATLLQDAGAKYAWSENEKSGSLPLGFEEVISKSQQADFWINLAFIQTKKDLINQDKRYADFKAFQKSNLFNNTLHLNSSGYSDYWESGIVYPDKILSDLIQIFHPALQDSIQAELNYYKKVPE